MKNILNKKGMTLVEVIVVLVILAILAAVLIPTMVGYIDKANQKTILAEARSVLLAAQTIESELYAEEDTLNETEDTELLKRVTDLAGVAEGSVSGIKASNGKVTEITYKKGGRVATYNDSNWTVTKS